ALAAPAELSYPAGAVPGEGTRLTAARAAAVAAKTPGGVLSHAPPPRGAGAGRRGGIGEDAGPAGRARSGGGGGRRRPRLLRDLRLAGRGRQWRCACRAADPRSRRCAAGPATVARNDVRTGRHGRPSLRGDVSARRGG